MNVEAACIAAKMVKRALPMGTVAAGTLVAMPVLTYLMNKLKGHDPRKTAQPTAHGDVAARLALQRALLGLEGQNPLLQSAQGLQAYRRDYT